MSSKKKLQKKIRKLEEQLFDLQVSQTKMQSRIAELERKNVGPFKGPFDNTRNPWSDPFIPRFDAREALQAVDQFVTIVQKVAKPSDNKD
ncbi:hypothetical protein PP304_gp115 [Gordonia phage Phendrix]|uniref:Uncharacterized protein n=1 Tax=Gordonia phage Phendrix TaxID=2593335 RepID=A0A514U138_9CAUD|nr:hypothetical protein PP304_gp115 [Gordonia phage Phendrix]QDK02663.1 hypothetical protein SEA_PHENDRIX_115 [Gordonia phage Phendrix]